MNALPDFADILAPIQARQSYRNGMAEKLTEIVADLLTKHEPLLKATRDGTEIAVVEKGGSLAFSISIEPQSPRERKVSNGLPGEE